MTDKPCKDCVAEGRTGKPLNAPHPGPRCYRHHNARKKDVRQARHAAYVAKTYSLDEGEYERLYLLQGGVCAICRRATGATRRLSVDHDHACCNKPVSCGKCVRGLLCRPCNDLLGHARDQQAFFARAINYLASPPARTFLRKDET